MMDTRQTMARLSFGAVGGAVRGQQVLPQEVAIALSFNGTTQAVMMATPADLIDFAYGFAMSEGIATPDEVTSVEVVELAQGMDVQVWVTPEAEARLARRRRVMAGPVGCGLCGIDSLAEVMRPVSPIPEQMFGMRPSEVMQAIAALPMSQPLHDETRAVHAAGLWRGGLQEVREDVGRHNALDKLIGCRLRAKAGVGAVLLTSRVSIDMVQKVAAFGAPILIAVSSPTAHAVTLADAAGLTLIALARPDRFEVFTHTDRLLPENAHVA